MTFCITGDSHLWLTIYVTCYSILRNTYISLRQQCLPGRQNVQKILLIKLNFFVKSTKKSHCKSKYRTVCKFEKPFFLRVCLQFMRKSYKYLHIRVFPRLFHGNAVSYHAYNYKLVCFTCVTERELDAINADCVTLCDVRRGETLLNDKNHTLLPSTAAAATQRNCNARHWRDTRPCKQAPVPLCPLTVRLILRRKVSRVLEIEAHTCTSHVPVTFQVLHMP